MLSLQNNELGIDFCLQLAHGIVLNNPRGSLRTLNLNRNKLGSKGVQLLCEALSENTRLESLFLNDNGIDSDGALALAKLLSVPQITVGASGPALKELHIAENKIASSGLSGLFDALAKFNKKLKFLDVSYNIIDIGLLRSLRQLVERNVTLHYLAISGLHKFN